MKKVIIALISAAFILTGCGQIQESSESSAPTSQVQTEPPVNKKFAEIEAHESGGEDGRNVHFHIFTDENGEHLFIFEDLRMNETNTYTLTDEQYDDIMSTDISQYIGKKYDYENVCDWIYYDIAFRSDDGTEEKVEVYIPELWDKLYPIYLKPVEENQPETEALAEKVITEVEMKESGGIDGRCKSYRVYTEDDGRKLLVFSDLKMDEKQVFEMSDKDYNSIMKIDYSKYIGKNDDNEGIYDAVYTSVYIRYSDGTEDVINVPVMGLSSKIHKIMNED